MESFLQIFGGSYTLFQGSPSLALLRIFLIILGCVLLYLCHKDVLDPLILVPMSLGMIAVNGAMLVLQDGRIGTIFIDPLVSDPTQLINVLQINFLQPLYTFTFSNGLIACLVFMGIGAITDISYLMATPFSSMLLAVGAEMGSVLTLPIAMAMGLTLPQSASIALIGGADGPMVLFTSLKLAPEYFVPITVIGYLYLSLTYAGYPFLIKWLVPKKLRGTAMNPLAIRKIPPAE
jgi:Na+-transporting methylmalonyl-CoA/oxaloacetate decarboxylase beta subunit